VNTLEILEIFYLEGSSMIDERRNGKNDRTGKILRTIGIIFFALATVMNLLGGIGTCFPMI